MQSKDNNYDHIIIDTNNIFHINHNAFKSLTYKVRSSVLVTGGIYGSLLMFQRLKKRYLKPNGKVWAIFDNAKSMENVRKIIDPSYKMNRKKMPKTFYRALDYFRLILLHHSNDSCVVYETGYEADDIAPVIIRQIPYEEKILVVSEDMDWSRLIDYNNHYVDQLMKKQVFDSHKFTEKFGFQPNESSIILYKVFRGDKVDNIPIGIRGFPTKTLLNLIDDYSNIYEIKENLDIISYLSDKWKQEISQNFARLSLNHQLASFLSLSDKDILDCVFECKYKPKNLKILYESLGFDIEKLDKRLYEDVYFKQSKTGDEAVDFWLHPISPKEG